MLLVRNQVLCFIYISFADVASSKLLNIFTQSIAQYDNALEMLFILGGGGSLNVKDPLSALICIITF